MTQQPDENDLGAQGATEDASAGSIASDAASHAEPVFGQLQMAIALLEAESVMMQARASMLAKNDKQVFERLLEVKRRVNDVLIQMVGGKSSCEYSLAVSLPSQGNNAAITKAQGRS